MSLARTSIQVRTRWIRLAVWFFACGFVLGPLSGCTAFQTVCSSKWMEDAFGADTDPIDHVLVRWDNRLRTAQDPQDYASGITGMIGRVYLLSEETKQMCDAHGTIVVGMLDMTPTASGKRPVPIAEWMFDAETLKKLKTMDPFSGVGYTLFLPWKEYRPEIKQVKLLVKYVTRKGEQHVADHSLVTLQSEDQPATTMRETIGPTLDRQIDMQMPMPVKRLQGANQPMPYASVPMEKIMPPPSAPSLPPANVYGPNASQGPDAPYQPIVMPSQVRNPQGLQVPQSGGQVQSVPITERQVPAGSLQMPPPGTTVWYGPPPRQ